jgi:hypothetical protein
MMETTMSNVIVGVVEKVWVLYRRPDEEAKEEGHYEMHPSEPTHLLIFHTQSDAERYARHVVSPTIWPDGFPSAQSRAFKARKQSRRQLVAWCSQWNITHFSLVEGDGWFSLETRKYHPITVADMLAALTEEG